MHKILQIHVKERYCNGQYWTYTKIPSHLKRKFPIRRGRKIYLRKEYYAKIWNVMDINNKWELDYTDKIDAPT